MYFLEQICFTENYLFRYFLEQICFTENKYVSINYLFQQGLFLKQGIMCRGFGKHVGIFMSTLFFYLYLKSF